MPLETPFWWYRKKGALASALAPLGRAYGRIAERRFAAVAPYRSPLPVICIGNFTAGGGGKTPTAIAVAALLKALGAKPAFLTRGYGGKNEGPVPVAQGAGARVAVPKPQSRDGLIACRGRCRRRHRQWPGHAGRAAQGAACRANGARRSARRDRRSRHAGGGGGARG